MGDVIRVCVYNPAKEQTSLACLERPLEYIPIIKDLWEAQEPESDFKLSTEQCLKCKLFLYPHGDTKGKPIWIRMRNFSDSSIRDNDLLSVSLSEDLLQLVQGLNGTRVSSEEVYPGREHETASHVDLSAFDSLMDESASNLMGGIDPIPFRDLSNDQSNNLQPSAAHSTTSSTSQRSKGKRNRSISSKFWGINKLAAKGLITKEQKDELKNLLINGFVDEIDRAFSMYENTGEASELIRISTKSAKMRSGSDDVGLSNTMDSKLAEQFEAELDLPSIDSIDAGLDFDPSCFDNFAGPDGFNMLSELPVGSTGSEIDVLCAEFNAAPTGAGDTLPVSNSNLNVY